MSYAPNTREHHIQKSSSMFQDSADAAVYKVLTALMTMAGEK